MNDSGIRSRRGKLKTSVAAMALAGALAAGGQAHATDGYFSHGYGAQSKGLAGASLAYPKDSLAIATNPAAAFALGNRTDVGLDYFQPDRHAELIGNGAGPNESFNGNGGGPSAIPEFALTRRIGEKLALGVAVYGNGGMKTDYRHNPFARFGASGAAGVSLEQILISPTAAYEFAPGQSLGIALNISDQKFKANGIQPFAGYSSDPAHFTNLGAATAWGYGVKIGYLGQLSENLSVGAFYQSRTYSGKFERYAGLFEDGGDFDIPSTYGAGFAYKVNGKLDIAVDVRRINNSEIDAVGNPLGLLFAGRPFGAAEGPGFGWRDVTATKIGANYRVNDAWQVRAGWGHSSNPVPRDQTLLNILAPGVVQNQFTAGATWTRPSGLEISAYVLDAPRETVKGSGSIPGGFGGGEANISLGETAFGIGFGWKH